MKNSKKINNKIRDLKQELNRLSDDFNIIQNDNNDEYIFDVSVKNQKALNSKNIEISKNLDILENENEKLFSRVSLLRNEVEKAIESFDKESNVLAQFKKFINSHSDYENFEHHNISDSDRTISFETENFNYKHSNNRNDYYDVPNHHNNLNANFGIEEQLKNFNNNFYPNTHIETTSSFHNNFSNDSNSISLNLFTQVHRLFENEIKNINNLASNKIDYLNRLFIDDESISNNEKSNIIKSNISNFINEFERNLGLVLTNANVNDVTKKEIKVIKDSYNNTILNSYFDLEKDLIKTLLTYKKNEEPKSVYESGVNYIDTTNINELKLLVNKVENDIQSEKSKWSVSNFSKEALEDYLFLNKIDSLSLENSLNKVYFEYCEEFVKKIEIKKDILKNLVSNFILYINDNCNHLILKISNEFKRSNKNLDSASLSNNNFFNQKSIELIESLKSKSSQIFKSLESYISELLSNASLESLRKNEINFDFISTFIKESIKDLNSKVKVVVDLSRKELNKIINLETIGFNSLKSNVSSEINEIFNYLSNSPIELEELLKDVHDINRNFLLTKLNKLEHVLILVQKYKDHHKDNYDDSFNSSNSSNNYLGVRLERLERQYSKIVNMLDPIANKLNNSQSSEHLANFESRINSKIDQLISNIIDDKKDYESKYSSAIEEILNSNEKQKQNILKIIRDLEEEKLNIISEESKKNAALNSDKLSELENLIAIQNKEIENLLKEKDEFVSELETFISNKKDFNDEKIEDIKSSINNVIDSFNTKINEFEYNFDKKLTTLNLESIDLVNDKNVKLFSEIEEKLTNNYEVVKYEFKNDLTQILNNVNELNNTYSLLKDQNALHDDKFTEINDQFSQFSFLLKNISETLVNKNGQQQEEINSLVTNLNNRFEKLITNLKNENYKSTKKLSKNANIANKKIKNIFDNSISEISSKFDNFISEVKKENKFIEKNQNDAISLVIESNRKQKENLDKVISDLEKSNLNLLNEIDQRTAQSENNKLKELEQLISLQNTELENLLIEKNDYIHQIENFLRDRKEKMTIEGLNELRNSIESSSDNFNKRVEGLETTFSDKINKINLKELDLKLSNNQENFLHNIENKLSQNFEIVKTEFNSNINSIINDINEINSNYANLNFDSKFGDINNQLSQFSFILKGIGESFLEKNDKHSSQINDLAESLNSQLSNLVNDLKNENIVSSNKFNENLKSSNIEMKNLFDKTINEINLKFDNLLKSVENESKLLEKGQNNAINLIIESNNKQKENLDKVIKELGKSNSDLLSEIDERVAMVENSKLKQLEQLISLQNTELENLLLEKNDYIHQIENFLRDRKEKMTIEGLNELKDSIETSSDNFNRRVEDLRLNFNQEISKINLKDLDLKLSNNQENFLHNIEDKLSHNFEVVRSEFNTNISSIISDINDINSNYANLNFDDKFNDINDQFSHFSFILKGISESFLDKNEKQSAEINNLAESLDSKLSNLVTDIRNENIETSNKFNESIKLVNNEIKSLFDTSIKEMNSKFDDLLKTVGSENKLLEKGINNTINLVIESNNKQKENLDKIINELEKSSSKLLFEIDERTAKSENSKLKQLEQLISLQNTELENLLIEKKDFIYQIENFLRDKKEKMTIEGLNELKDSIQTSTINFNKKVEDLETSFGEKISNIKLKDLDSKLASYQDNFLQNIESKLSHNFDVVRNEFNANINSIISDINDINSNYANLNFDDKFNDINDQFSNFSFLLKRISESFLDSSEKHSNDFNNLAESLTNKLTNLLSDLKNENIASLNRFSEDIRVGNSEIKSLFDKSINEINAKFDNLLKSVESENKLLEKGQNNAVELIIESNNKQKENIDKIINELNKSNSNLLFEIDQRAIKAENSKLKQLEQLINLQNSELENLLIEKNDYINKIETFLNDRKEKMTVEGLNELRQSIETSSNNFYKKIEGLELSFNEKINNINLNDLDAKISNNQSHFFSSIESKLSQNFEIVRNEFNSNINSIINDINEINANYANLNFDDKFNDINDQFSQFSFILKGISESLISKNNEDQSKEIEKISEILNNKFETLLNNLKSENKKMTSNIRRDVKKSNKKVKSTVNKSIEDINLKFQDLLKFIKSENKILENSQSDSINWIIKTNNDQKENINKIINELEKSNSNLLSEIDERAIRAENSKLKQLEELISLQNFELENLLLDKNEYIHEVETFLKDKKEKITVEGLNEIKQSLELVSKDFGTKIEDLEFAFNKKIEEINLNEVNSKLINKQEDFFANIEGKLSQNFDIVRNEFNSNINSIIKDINDINSNYANLSFDDKFNDINDQFSQFSFILKGISETLVDKNGKQSKEVNELVESLNYKFMNLIDELRKESLESTNKLNESIREAGYEIKSLFKDSLFDINNKFESLLQKVDSDNKLLESNQNNAINLIIEINREQRERINKIITELDKSNSKLLSEIDQRAIKAENSKLKKLEELISLQNEELENLLIDKDEYIHEIEKFLRNKKETFTVQGLEELKVSLESVSQDFNNKVKDLEIGFNKKIDEINLDEIDAKLINKQSEFFNNIENKLSQNFDIVRNEFNSNISSIISDINDINSNYANLNFDDKFNDINDQFFQFSFILKGIGETFIDKNNNQSKEFDNLVETLSSKFENLVSDLKSENIKSLNLLDKNNNKANRKIKSMFNSSISKMNNKFNSMLRIVKKDNKALEMKQNDTINFIIQSNNQQQRNIKNIIDNLEKSNLNILSEIDKKAIELENSKLKQLENLISLQNSELENLIADKNNYINEIEKFLRDKKESLTVQGLDELKSSLEDVSESFNKKVEDLEYVFNQKVEEINLKELDKKMIANQQNFFDSIEYKLSQNFDIVKNEFNSNINAIIQDIDTINSNYANLNFDEKFNEINDQFSQFSFLLRNISETFIDKNSEQSREINNLVDNLNIKFTTLINDLRNENIEIATNLSNSVEKVSEKFEDIFRRTISNIDEKFISFANLISNESRNIEVNNSDLISKILESNKGQQEYISRIINKLESSNSNLLAEYDSIRKSEESLKLKELEELIQLQNDELNALLNEKNDYVSEVENFLNIKKEELNNQNLVEIKQSIKDVMNIFDQKINDLEFSFDRKFNSIDLKSLNHELVSSQKDFFENVESKLSNNYDLVRTEFKQDIGGILNNINYLSEKYENSSNFQNRFNDIDEQLSQFRNLMKDMSEAFISKNNNQYNEVNQIINKLNDNFNNLIIDIKNENSQLNEELLRNISKENAEIKNDFEINKSFISNELKNLSDKVNNIDGLFDKKHFEIIDTIIKNNKISQKEIKNLIHNIENSNNEFLTEIEIRNNNINNLKLKDLENLISLQNSEIESLLNEKNEFIYEVENLLLDKKIEENDVNFEKIQNSINNVINSLNSKIYDLEIGFDKKLANIDISSLKGEISESQSQLFNDMKNQLTGNYEILKSELNSDLNRILNNVSSITEDYETSISKFDGRFNEIDEQFNEFRILFKNVTESLLTKNSENYDEINKVVENLDNKFISLISNIKNENIRNSKKISKEIYKVKKDIDKKIDKSIDKIDDKFGVFLNEIKEQNKYFENKQLDTINSIIESNKNNQREILGYIKNFEHSNAQFINELQAERFMSENSKLKDLESLISLQNSEIESLLNEKNEFINEVEKFIHNKRYELDSKNIKELENSINNAIENFDSKINLLELNFDKKLNSIDLSSLSDLISNEQLQLVDSVQNSLTYNYELVKNEFKTDLNQILNNVSLMNENYESLLLKNYDNRFDLIDDQFNSFRLILKELIENFVSRNNNYYDEIDNVVKNVNVEFINIINNLKNESKNSNKYISNKIKKSNRKLERKIDSSLFEMNSKFDKFLEEMKIQSKNIENNNNDAVKMLVETNKLNQMEIFQYIQQLENKATGLVNDLIEIQNRKDTLKLKELEELISLQNSEIESLIQDKNDFIDEITLFLNREKELVTNENFEKLERSIENIIGAFNRKIINLEFNLEKKISDINLDSISDTVKEEKVDLLNSVKIQLQTNFDVVRNSLNLELNRIIESIEENNNTLYKTNENQNSIKFDELNSQFDQFRVLLKEVTEGFISKNDSNFEQISNLTKVLDDKFDNLLESIKIENKKHSSNLSENVNILNKNLLSDVSKEFTSNAEKFDEFINKLDEKTRIFEETQIDLISSLFETNKKYQEIILTYVSEIKNSNNEFLNKLDQRTRQRDSAKLKELENLINLQNSEINQLLDENNKYINDVEEFLLSKKESLTNEKLEKIEKSVLNISEIFDNKISALESEFKSKIKSINLNELEENLSIFQKNILSEMQENLFKNYELLRIEFNENFNSVSKVVNKFYDYFNNKELEEKNRFNEYSNQFEQLRNILSIISENIIDKTSKDYELLNNTVALIYQKIENLLIDIKNNNESSTESISSKFEIVSNELSSNFSNNLLSFENKLLEVIGVIRNQVDEVKNSNITSINLVVETNQLFKEEIATHIKAIRNENFDFLKEIESRRISENSMKLNELSNLIDLQNSEIDSLLAEKVEFIEKVENFLTTKKELLLNEGIDQIKDEIQDIAKKFDTKISNLEIDFSNRIYQINSGLNSLFDEGYLTLKDQQNEFVDKLDSRVVLNFDIVRNEIKTDLIEVVSEIEKLKGINQNFIREINSLKINEITNQFESFNLLLKDIVEDIVVKKGTFKDLNLVLDNLNDKFNDLINNLKNETNKNSDLIINELSQLRYDIKDEIFSSLETINQNFEELLNQIKLSNKNLENSQIDAINLITEANNLNKKELISYIDILENQNIELINELDKKREESLIFKIKEFENLIDIQNKEIDLLFADKEEFITEIQRHLGNIKSFNNDFDKLSKTDDLIENLLRKIIDKINSFESDLTKKIKLIINDNDDKVSKHELAKIEENILNNYSFLKSDFQKLFDSLSSKIENAKLSSNDGELKENLNKISEELSDIKNLKNISINDLRDKNLLLERLDNYVSEKLGIKKNEEINEKEFDDQVLIEKIKKLEDWYESLSTHINNKNNFIKDYVDNKINEIKTPINSSDLNAIKVYDSVVKEISEIVNLLNLSKNNIVNLISKISKKIAGQTYFNKSLIWMNKLLSYNEKIINEINDQNKKYLESITHDKNQNRLQNRLENLIFVSDILSKNENILKNEFSTFELEVKAFDEICKKSNDKKIILNFIVQLSGLIRENTNLVSRIFITFDGKKDSNLIKIHSIEDLLKQAKDNVNELSKLELNEQTVSIFLKEIDKIKNILLSSHFDLLVLKENEIEKTLLNSKFFPAPIEFKKISLLEDLVKYTKDDLKNILSQKIRLMNFLTENKNDLDKEFLLEYKASEIYNKAASKLTKKQIADINEIVKKFNELEKEFYSNKTNIISAENIKNKSLMYSQISKLELQIVKLFEAIEGKKKEVVKIISSFVSSNEDKEIKKLIKKFEDSKEIIESEFESEINAFKEMINNSKKEEIENYKKELLDLEKEMLEIKSKSENLKEFEPLENLIEELHLEITSFEQEKENQYKEVKTKLEYLNSLNVSDENDISNAVNTDKFKLNLNFEVKEFIENEFIEFEIEFMKNLDQVRVGLDLVKSSYEIASNDEIDNPDWFQTFDDKLKNIESGLLEEKSNSENKLIKKPNNNIKLKTNSEKIKDFIMETESKKREIESFYNKVEDLANIRKGNN